MKNRPLGEVKGVYVVAFLDASENDNRFFEHPPSRNKEPVMEKGKYTRTVECAHTKFLNPLSFCHAIKRLFTNYSSFRDLSSFDMLSCSVLFNLDIPKWRHAAHR